MDTVARNDRMVKIDGAAVEARRLALGLTRDEIGAEPGSPSGSTWEAVERNRRPEFTERTAKKIETTLARLEAAGGSVQVPSAQLASILEELAALRSAVEALEARQGSGS